MDKKQSRIRRCIKNRAQLKKQHKIRLSVHRTAKHIYAQILSADGSQVLAQASSLDKALRSELSSTSNQEAASKVGKLLAERGTANGIKKVTFDRSGFKYFGRVKALADAARESGLEF